MPFSRSSPAWPCILFPARYWCSAMRTLLFVLPLVLWCCSLIAQERPNVVIILCDDMGFSDLGCYGGEIATPNLDRLAASGLRFTDFHNNAKCTETRASLLTGLWHQQSDNLKTPGHVTIAEVLRDAGYSTMMSGKWHVAQTHAKARAMGPSEQSQLFDLDAILVDTNLTEQTAK